MNNRRLKETEINEILEAFISDTPVGILVLDLEGKIKHVNRLACEYLDLPNDLKLSENSNILDIVRFIPELHEVLKKNIRRQKNPFNIELLIYRDKYFAIRGRLIPDGYIITIKNITKQKEIEASSIQSILEGQENERRRIGREIHDGIGPLLSYIKLSLDSFIDDLHQQNPDASTDILDNISETIDAVTIDLRSLSHRLVPRLLDEFGLIPAFENLIFRLNEIKKANIHFYSNIGKDIRLAKDIELNIFRCAQELINNAIKYANAGHILVQIIIHKKSVVLMVEDDGIGFEKEKLLTESYGIGLTNIDTRVRVLKGEFIIESSAGKGTFASIEIPI